FFSFYVGFTEVLYMVLVLFFTFFFLRRNKKLYQKLKPLETKKIAVYMLSVFGVLVYLKLSKHIVYNLPYLVAKSVYEYTQISKSFEAYTQNKKGNFTNVQLESDQHNSVFVLILGESTVRTHMELYGYERQTTPLLKSISDELWIYPDVISPHTQTVESVTKMLTLGNYESPEKIESGSIIQLANAAGFDTFWLSNQRPVGMYESLVTKIALSASMTKFLTVAPVTTNQVLDEALLPELDIVLKNNTDKPKFIVIHLMGTHFDYQNRYPESLQTFSNVPKLNYSSEENHINVNAYDQAVLYTDYIVTEEINKVKNLSAQSTVLYLSDHGEELYMDKNMAGHNESIATKSMYEIPFVLWQSDEYKKSKSLIFDAQRPYMTDDLFHSLAQLLQIKATEVSTKRSIFSHDFQNRQRIILGNEDFDVKFESIDNQNSSQK
ncbi:MAG: phosphoethanolamine transferase, partial [Bacteroidetes bacterium]|nr:phosphoethanolamine transferase [Bacteroidota bacterium]